MNTLSKNQIDKAGKILQHGAANPEYEWAIEIVNRWRKMHGAPMDFYYDKSSGLIDSLQDDNAFVAERLKRFSTIVDKLKRPNLHCRLSAMQDIAGVRIVVSEMSQAGEVENALLKWDGLKGTPKDHIKTPKPDGYRAKHFIFEKDGMLVEVQLKTFLQHLWSTTVETMDMFLGSSMKTGVKINPLWGEFFRMVSSLFAYMEETPMVGVYDELEFEELCRNFASFVKRHGMKKKLKKYAMTRILLSEKFRNDDYFALMFLGDNLNSATVSYFKEDEYDKAVMEYERQEREHGDGGVLVSVNDLKKLQEAYPNYFMDLTMFMEKIDTALEKYKELM